MGGGSLGGRPTPNHFEFIFTPTHGSFWLNLIKPFFGRMARTSPRGIRVKSKEELRTRIEMYLRKADEEPVVFRWKYKLETLSVVLAHCYVIRNYTTGVPCDSI